MWVKTLNGTQINKVKKFRRYIHASIHHQQQQKKKDQTKYKHQSITIING